MDEKEFERQLERDETLSILREIERKLGMTLTEIVHLRSDVQRTHRILQTYLGPVALVVFWTWIYWAVQKFFGWPN